MKRVSAILSIIVVVAGVRFVACAGDDVPERPSARDEFVMKYARARAAAVQYDHVARLCIEAAAGRFWVEVDTGVPGAAMADTIGGVVDLSAEHPDVEMAAAADTLCFDARGLAYVGGACDPHGIVVTFSQRGAVDTVQLSPGGTVVRR